MGPQRLRLERRAGFDLQAMSHALNGLPAQTIARPGKWGNPFVIAEVAEQYGLDAVAAQVKAIALYRRWDWWGGGALRAGAAGAGCDCARVEGQEFGVLVQGGDALPCGYFD